MLVRWRQLTMLGGGWHPVSTTLAPWALFLIVGGPRVGLRVQGVLPAGGKPGEQITKCAYGRGGPLPPLGNGRGRRPPPGSLGPRVPTPLPAEQPFPALLDARRLPPAAVMASQHLSSHWTSSKRVPALPCPLFRGAGLCTQGRPPSWPLLCSAQARVGPPVDGLELL